MVELRKRKQPAQEPPPAKKRAAPPKKQAAKDKPSTRDQDQDQAGSKSEDSKLAPSHLLGGDGHKPEAPVVGDTLKLDSFGGELETNDGTKVTLKELVDQSKAGVVLFTYPK
jgi:thioredoxin-dependent peroxiredoxin